MSRVGKNPVEIPDGITVEIKDEKVFVKGKNAELSVPILSGISVSTDGSRITFSTEKENKQSLSNWGTMRSLVQNAVFGASENFEKKLIIEGVGYRANVEGKDLVLGLGYSHPIKFPIPEGIEIKVDKNTVTVAGPNKEQVGEVSAKIRGFRKPEPYKGKGIRYSDEVIRRKVGKKAIGTGE